MARPILRGLFNLQKSVRRNRIVEFHSDNRGFEYRTNVDYVMGIDGELNGPQGERIEKQNEDYRNEDRSIDSLELERSIQEKKEELKRLEERRIQKTSGLYKKIKQENDSARFASGPALPSLNEWF